MSWKIAVFAIGGSHRSVIVTITVILILLSTHAQSFEKSSHKLFASTKLRKVDEQKVKIFMKASSTPEDFDDLEFDESTHYDEPGVVPELPLIKLFNEVPLEVGQSVTIGCLSRNGDPTADLSWFLDNKELNETVLDFEETGDDRSTSNTLSVIQWDLKVEDDGKILTCHAKHPGYLKGFVETKHKLNINFSPTKQPTKVISEVKVGQSVDISVSFRSNPKPTTIKWLVGDTKIYYGAKTSKCVSREIKAIGHNFWSASLQIANVTDEDISSIYKLQVRNPIGSADYIVQLEGENKINQTMIEASDKEILTTTEVPIDSTTVMEKVDDSTIVSIFSETDGEIETTTLIESETTLKPSEKILSSEESELSEARTEGLEMETTDEPETTTFEIESEAEDISTEIILTDNNQVETQSSATPKQETKNDKIRTKTKVSKIIIFKRPINISESSDIENSKVNETSYDFGLNFVQSSLTEVASKAIVYWKTSLLIILTIVLILSFTYHRHRIMKLKAEIIQKNLGVNQSSSTFPHSLNAYTPTYFPRRLLNDHKLPINLSDYDSSSRSRSNLYSQTYNSSFHSYESIIDLHGNERFDVDQMRKIRIDEDGESGEHIYAEIPWKSEELSDQKFRDDENNSATSIIEYDYNHLDHTEPLNIEAPHIYHALIRQGSDPGDAMNLQIESTYI